MRDAGQEDVVEVAQDRRERLGVFGRLGRQPGADVAGRDLGEHRQIADALEVIRRPLERRAPVAAQVRHAVVTPK